MTRAKGCQQRTGSAQNQKTADIQAVQGYEGIVRPEQVQSHCLVQQVLPQGMKPVGRINPVKGVERRVQRISRNSQIVEGIGLKDGRLSER
jgi:hypothetical protein